MRTVVLWATFLLAIVAACQQPADSAVPAGSAGPGGTPVAPAIEPGQPSPEQPIQLPTGSPVAPAIEPGRPSPEQPISFDPG